MIPDKIYIAETPNKLIEIWSDEPVEPKPYIKEHCYIRKEALLEWLNERYKSTISNVGCYTGHSVWAEVIEHLNEM